MKKLIAVLSVALVLVFSCVLTSFADDSTMVDLLTVLRDRAMYIFIAVFFILLVIVAFKFVIVRGRNV